MPDSDRWRAVRARFDELVALEPAARAARIRELEASEPDLAAAVTRLLDADGAADRRLAALDALFSSQGPAAAGDDAPAPDPMGLVGRDVSRFRVLELLGAGGMGVVYRAQDARLGRVVALKLPLPAQQADPSGRSRFLREARAAATLDHPNICEVHEVGEAPDGRLYLAMRYYEGETLRDRLARSGPLTEDEAVSLARQVAAGLAAAHAAGIVHRDLKPGNIMLPAGGGVKLLDFGLAKVSDASATATGDLLGTVAYMAPEQLRSEPVDHRTDLWALGVILYEMVTATRPFTGGSDISVAHAILHDAPPSPARHRAVSAPIADIVLRLLERDPARRYPSAAAVADALAPAALAGARGWRPAAARNVVSVKRAARRHRGAVAALSVVALGAALVLATGGLRGGAGDEDPGTADSVALDFYRRGRAYEARGLSDQDFRSAGALYRNAIARDSGFALPHARLAISELRLRPGIARPEDAADILAGIRRALGRDSAPGDGHLAMGLYWSAVRQPDSALASFARARRQLPRSAEVARGAAFVHLGAGRWEDAVAELERARSLEPADLETSRLLAYTYSRLRRYADAAQAWEQVTVRVPDDYLSLLIKGYLYIRLEGSSDTLAAVLRRIPAGWDEGGMKTYAAVLAARIARRPAEALPALDSARWLVSADRYTFRPVHLLRAQVYDDLGDSAAAHASYQRTLEVVEDSLAERPADPRLQIARGWALAGIGRTAEAVAAAHRAMALLPAQANAFDGIPYVGAAAEVLGRAGDARGAVALLDSLLLLPAGREVSVALLRADPTWDRIRGDPGFTTLLRRYGGRER